MSTEERLDKLEIDLAHAMHTIDELNGVVFEQGKQLDRMRRRLADMTDQMEELIDNLPAAPIDKPPHY